jgi:hypothetical protein
VFDEQDRLCRLAGEDAMAQRLLQIPSGAVGDAPEPGDGD